MLHKKTTLKSGTVESHSKIPTNLVRIPLLMVYIISLLIMVSVLGQR